jgi:hypothetical protein
MKAKDGYELYVTARRARAALLGELIARAVTAVAVVARRGLATARAASRRKLDLLARS